MMGCFVLADNTRVYVGQLDYGVQWYELKDHMKLAGHVERAEIMEDANGRSKGYAIVEFANAEGGKTRECSNQ